ncbi:MAG: glycoside hydrolase family 13 protein [Lachnospiraceae bacterium]
MNRQALFCDGTGSYVMPPEPKRNQEVRMRFRTAKDDVDTIYLVTGADRYQLKKAETRGMFDYYELQREMKEEKFSYYFEIHADDGRCCYNKIGAVDKAESISSFTIVPGFATPAWSKGAVMYQIFTDRFYNGDPANDVKTGEYFYIDGISRKVTDWNEYPASGTKGVREFYGGDLKGVMDKLDYLQDLGVEVIYFNPLFVSPSNHKYDIQDYDYIDPHFGVIINDGGTLLTEDACSNEHAETYRRRITDMENLRASNALFAEMVEEIHARGMKVILDGVFNHCGSFNKWMDRELIYKGRAGFAPGAYVSEDSPYHSFFKFHESGSWPCNGNYDGWWGHDTLPKLDYEESQKLEDYILDIGRKWVSPPYNVDGWRLDVAADLGYSNEYNHRFWKRFRQAVKEVNPNVLILAEHYGDPKEWLDGDEWDTVMNYDAFMEPVTWFLTGMEKHSDDYRNDLRGNGDYFRNTIGYHMARFMTPSLQSAMNELSNHDHSRFLTRTNCMVGRIDTRGPEAAEKYLNHAVMREAVVMQMTWVGAPTVYYGDEAGLCGFTDPDNRRTYPWGNENQELLQFHKELIAIHKKYEAFKTGSLKLLLWNHNCLAYARFDRDEQFIIIINNSSELREVKVPAWEAEVGQSTNMSRLVYTYDRGYSTEYDEVLVRNGQLVLNMGGHSAIILRNHFKCYKSFSKLDKNDKM